MSGCAEEESEPLFFAMRKIPHRLTIQSSRTRNRLTPDVSRPPPPPSSPAISHPRASFLCFSPVPSYLAGLFHLLDHFHAWKLSRQKDFLDFWIILASVPSPARRSLTQRASCAPYLQPNDYPDQTQFKASVS